MASRRGRPRNTRPVFQAFPWRWEQGTVGPSRPFRGQPCRPRRAAVSSPLDLTTIKLLEYLIRRAHEFLIGRKGMRQFGRTTKQLLLTSRRSVSDKASKDCKRCCAASPMMEPFYAGSLRGITPYSPARLSASGAARVGQLVVDESLTQTDHVILHIPQIAIELDNLGVGRTDKQI